VLRRLLDRHCQQAIGIAQKSGKKKARIAAGLFVEALEQGT
jgi:hypothetical protein